MCFRVFEPFDVFRPFSSGFGVSPLVAALDLRFYLGEVDAGITTTRATTATRFNEFGTQESVATRSALAAVGWGAAAWNIAAITGAASGVGGLVAIIAGWLAADAAENDAPLRCAGVEQ